MSPSLLGNLTGRSLWWDWHSAVAQLRDDFILSLPAEAVGVSAANAASVALGVSRKPAALPMREVSRSSG